jgi:predicted amidohydrolase
MDRLMLTCLLPSLLLQAAFAMGADVAGGSQPGEAMPCVPKVDGPFVHVYDPARDTGNPKSYNNDHAIIFGPDKLFHKIGILNITGGSHAEEDQFDHITSPELLKTNWKHHDYALTIDERRGEKDLMAPHIVEKDGTYYMFYASYDEHETNNGRIPLGQIYLATSNDLFHWTRHPTYPIIGPNAPFARDPMVRFDEDRNQWVMYYTVNDTQWHSTVAYRTSKDLIHWSTDIKYALIAEKRRGSAYTESPFVVKYRGYYYLFVTSWPIGYHTTRVFRSRDPYHFTLDQQVATLDCHAAEIIEHQGQWYITHCGSEAHGLHVATLQWAPASLRVSVVQMRSSSHPAENAARICGHLRKCAADGARVAVFPECATSGFTEEKELKVSADDVLAAEQKVCDACRKLGIYCIVGTPTRDGERWLNSAIVIDPIGRILERYHKVQVAEPWPEGGDHLAVFHIDDVPCSIIICHDERYPELVRLPVLAGARVIFYLSHESGIRAEHKLEPYRAQIQARAVENTVYAVHANAPANDDLSGSHGQSRIVAPNGQILHEASMFGEDVFVETLDLARATRDNAMRSLTRGPLRAWWEAGVKQVRIIP